MQIKKIVCCSVRYVQYVSVDLCVCVLHVLSLTEFDWSIHPQQYVVTLDVSMDDLVGMKKLQSLDNLDA